MFKILSYRPVKKIITYVVYGTIITVGLPLVAPTVANFFLKEFAKEFSRSAERSEKRLQNSPLMKEGWYGAY